MLAVAAAVILEPGHAAQHKNQERVWWGRGMGKAGRQSNANYTHPLEFGLDPQPCITIRVQRIIRIYSLK